MLCHKVNTMDVSRAAETDSISAKLAELEFADRTQYTDDGPHPYLRTIFGVSDKYLRRVFNEHQLNEFKTDCFRDIQGDRDSTIEQYINKYYEFVKREYQKQYSSAESSLNQFIFSDPKKPKALWGDCLDFLRRMDSESVQLMVTSPPYYNARDYSQWETLDDYLNEMSCIIKECLGLFSFIDIHFIKLTVSKGFDAYSFILSAIRVMP